MTDHGEYIARVVAAAPPLTPAQRDRIGAIFAAANKRDEPTPKKTNPRHELIERLAEGLDDV